MGHILPANMVFVQNNICADGIALAVKVQFEANGIIGATGETVMTFENGDGGFVFVHGVPFFVRSRRDYDAISCTPWGTFAQDNQSANPCLSAVKRLV
jgi:hypothetical protein